MKQFFTVFRFTFMDAVRKKAFIASTAILLILILIACMIPRAIDWFTPDKSGAPNDIAQAGDGLAALAHVGFQQILLTRNDRYCILSLQI